MAIKIESALRVTESGSLSAPEKPKGLSIGELERALLHMFPAADAEEWDRTGLLVGDPRAEVKAVAVALDPTPRAVREAYDSGANVLLTHHPAFIDPPKRFGPLGLGAPVEGTTVYEAISHNVALMNFHTALDVSAQARAMLPGMLRLSVSDVLLPLSHDPKRGYGQVCTFLEDENECSLGRLAARATAVFGRQPRVWGDMNRIVSTVVTWTGSASGAASACVSRGVDVLICGEIKYHEALDAAASGLCVIELGHDVSELPFIAVLADAIARAGVPTASIRCLDQSGNWTTPEARRA